MICCLDDDCIHPICKHSSAGTSSDIPTWYPGGPTVYYLPIPFPKKVSGDVDCSICKEGCTGHYETKLIDVRTLTDEVSPPSAILKAFFQEGCRNSQANIEEVAKKTLLPLSEVELWLTHLESTSQSRKRGAAKRAATHQKSKKAAGKDAVHCNGCFKAYQETTEEMEVWVACDSCNCWYHCDCEGLSEVPSSDFYVCTKCR